MIVPSPASRSARDLRALRRRDGPLRTRRWRAVALIAAAVLGCELLLAADGRIDVVDERAGPGSRTDWTRPCAAAHPRPDRQLLHNCARVRGRVRYTRDDERLSGGRTETHLLVVADLHLLVVKLGAGLRVPTVGAPRSPSAERAQAEIDVRLLAAGLGHFGGCRRCGVELVARTSSRHWLLRVRGPSATRCFDLALDAFAPRPGAGFAGVRVRACPMELAARS